MPPYPWTVLQLLRSPARFTVRRVLHLGLPIVVGAALLVSLVAWAASSPPGSAPDDDFHLPSIWCASDAPGPECEAVDVGHSAGVIYRKVPESVAGAACYATHIKMGAACELELSDNLTNGRANDGLYPWGFHQVMHLLVGDDTGRAVMRMRIFNGALGAILLAVALSLSTGALRRAAALTWLAILAPLTMFFLPSTNPTSWAIMALGTYWIFLLRFLASPGGRGAVAAVFAAVTALMACMARTDATAYLCVVTFACMVAAPRKVKDMLRFRYALPVVIGLGAFIRFLTLQSSNVLASGMSPYDASEPGRHGLVLFLGNLMNLPTLLTGMVGAGFGLGWLDTPVPEGVAVISCGILAGLVVLAARSLTWRRAAMVILIATVIVGLALLILQQSHAHVGEAIQPRYLLPLLAPMVGLLLYQDESAPPITLPMAVAWLFALGAAFVNAVALFVNLRRYIIGLSGTRLNIDHHRDWWWTHSISPVSVWLIGAVAGLALYVLLSLTASGAYAGLAASAHGDDDSEVVEGPVTQTSAVTSAAKPHVRLGAGSDGRR